MWTAWGLSLLKIGKYTEAKEKFNYCLTSSEHSKNIPLDRVRLLNEIIAALEHPAPPDQESLRIWHDSMSQVRVKSARSEGELSMQSYLNALNV